MDLFICPLCGNSDPRYIGVRPNGVKYCRYCLSLHGEEVDDSAPFLWPAEVTLNYSLSEDQITVSNELVEAISNNKNVLIHAICGAGKTELVYEAMKVALNKGLQVGFAIPRRDVVIELSVRLRDAFPGINVTAVYGGHTNHLTGDIIILTTHQLYRYPQYFDLLVFDEIDAFPYKDNDLLQKMFIRATKGNYVMLSATPSDKFINDFKKEGVVLELFTRFHRHPLPVPKIVRRYGIMEYFYVIKALKKYEKLGKPVLVFVPTVASAETLARALKPFLKLGTYVHSRCSDRGERIKAFVQGKYNYLVTTSVLERGVTIKNLQVIIYQADAWLYDEATLVQISGRVGRKVDAPTGDVIFLATKKTKAMISAIKNIEDKNAHL